MKKDMFKKCKIMAALSLFLAALMLFSGVSEYAVYAKNINDASARDKQKAYGKDWADDTFYIWYKVTDAKGKPLFKYLSDGESNSDAYTKDKKTFRVLLTFEFKESDSHSTIHDRSCDSSKPVPGKGLHAWEVHYFWENYWLYYEANWTAIDYSGTVSNYGTSVYRVDQNPQIQAGKDVFITRGAQKSFICDYDRQWKNGGGDHKGTLDSIYDGTYRYHFYYPDETDRVPVSTLTYVNSTATNFFAYDKDGNAWGNQSHKNKRSAYDSEDVIDTWALYNRFDGKMGMVAHDGNFADHNFCMDDNGYTNLLEVEDYHNAWTVYVGEPCPEYLIDKLADNETNHEILREGEQRTISKPSYLGAGKTLKIEKDAVLFVESILFVNGGIDNQGIIVLNEGGAIVQWDRRAGMIVNSGGDIIARAGSGLFLDEYDARNHQAILSESIVARSIDLADTVSILYQPQVKIGGAEYVKDYTYMSLTKQTDGKYKITFNAEKLQPGSWNNRQDKRDPASVKEEKKYGKWY